jgi:cytochrome c peroxidase
MKNLLFGFIGLLLLAVSFQSCGDEVADTFKDYSDEEYAIITKSLNLPSELLNYSSKFEDAFFINHLGEEDIRSRRSDHKATLGRVLFYDKKLSINESISCASCHKQTLGFADDVAFSEGFDGKVTTRNSLPLGNTIGFETAYGGFTGRALFSWDESNENISSQSKAAIISEIEMGMDMGKVVDRIKKDEAYPILFRKVYGDSQILQHRVLEAIEEFVNSIVSKETKFDEQSMKHDGDFFNDFEGYTQSENLGKQLYLQNCATCHSSDHMFTSKAIANNGLDMDYEDKGVGARTNQPSKNGVFKVPFLRNIDVTAPYMHDGRFENLREVINHYSEGIVNHPNLDSELKDGFIAKKMNFTENEKDGLEAYLKTLTDENLKVDVRFSDPFI